jgi:hypothetical protein
MTSGMVDRPRVLVVGAVVTVAVVFLLGLGFVVGRATSEDDGASAGGPEPSGDGLPAGPTGLDGGVPVGFARDEDGARAAALAWFPWLNSSPVGERPEGIDTVLANGVDAPGEDVTGRLASVRLQFAPIAVQVEMESDDRATVTMLGSILAGEPGEPLSGELVLLPVDLEWDDSVADWRITALPSGSWEDYTVGDSLDAGDVAGFEAIRPAGVVEGSPIVEEVPGE